MQKNLKKVLSLLLTIVMVMGIVAQAVPVFAAEVVSSSDLPTTMEGLSIAYPYNTETVQLTGTPADRFDALTFESARGEVESAQMILTPNFNVDSFELTMNSLKNENGNIIPGWAFEVFVQHYVTVKGSGNATYWSDDHQMYNPTYSKNGYDGTFPDALIPQDTAIAAGENTVTAGENQGIWVNLNVQDAAPGTYTGFATLAVNGSDMQIPVSVHVYDVKLPEEIHARNFIAVWWDMVQAAEGHLDRELADIYFDYLVSKRITPMDAWSVNRWDDALAEAAVEWAADPRITSYLITHSEDADGNFDAAAMKTKLTVMINKQLEVGDSVDLFKKGYFYIYDEPRDDKEYKIINDITAKLDAIKAELAPMLDAYPSIKESFMNLKQFVTAPNPTDKTYSKVGSIWNYFINDDYGSTVLTGDSYIYAPQYQWLNTAAQRAMYANEEELWWYGCCHPIAPYPTYHINTPLVSARVESWMRYAYDIDGFLYSSVNIWGQYTDSGISLFDYWNGYNNNGTPGDQILVLPGSDYGVEGPIGTIRIENIREAQEDYEYLWMLENEYGISDISTYTANLYEGAIPSTDASIHYNNRKALLTKLEQLYVAKNGATVIAPGQEGFVRGELQDSANSPTIQLDESVNAQAVTFDYKIVSGEKFGFVLMPDWSNFYGYFDFTANGAVSSYNGITCVPLDDGYVRVVIDLNQVTAIAGTPTRNIDFMWLNSGHGKAVLYMDNLQVLTEVPEIEIPTEPPVTEPPVTEPPVTEPPVTEPPVTEPPVTVFEGGEFTPGKTISIANTQEISKMSFDYKITSGDKISIAFLPDWSSYYGYFDMTVSGCSANGITTEKLSDGYIRVFVDMEAITKIGGTPSSIITMLYVHATWSNANGVIENIRINESALIPSRGTALTPDVNQTISVGAKEEVGLLSFDYKIVDGEKFTVALMPDWSNFYGNYEFVAAGTLSSYEGVTVEALEDGYNRVTFEMSKLTRIAGSPTSVIDFLFMNPNNCDAEGFIDNVQYVLKKDMPRGTALTPGVNQTVSVGAKEEIGILSFDYKITAGEKFTVALMPDWNNFYGHYEFVAAGTLSSYEGVTVEALEDGYNRVTLELSKLTKIAGSPTNIIDFLFMNANNCTADGYIDNIQYVLKKDMPRGTALTPGVNQQIMVSAKETLTSLSFDYKITTGEKFAVALMPNWSSYYGYFEFDAEATNTYNGVVYEKMDDGYVRVTFDMASLDKSAGEPTTIIDFLFINGSYSNAEGYIDNVQYTVGCNHSYDAVVTNPDCENGGYTTYTCSKCGESYVDNYTEALGHSYEAVTTAPTFTTNGFTTHTCANCGNSYVTDEVSAYTVSVSEWNIALGDDISATFYLNIDSRIEAPTAKVTIGTSSSDAVLTKQENGTYAVTVKVAAAQMTDNISIQVVNGDAVSEAMTYTIRQYAEKILTGEYDAKTQNLVKAMLNYGAMAQTYFGYNAGDLANKNYVNAETVEVPSVDTSNMVSGSADGIRFYGASLVFESKVAVRFYFTVTGDINSYTFSTGSDPVLKNGMYYIEVADINPQDYATDIVLTVNDALTVTYSPLTYISRKASADNALANLVKAMYVYHLAAVEFLSEPEVIYRGEAFEAGVDKTLSLDNAEVLESVSFEYKIVDGTKFNIALMEDWSNFYSYYAFTAAGASENYAGVTTELLDDGYIRVTFKITELNKISGAPTGAIQFLYIRGGWSDSNGYIDNITYTIYQPKLEFEGGDFAATTGATFVLDNDQAVTRMTFDYAIESGEYFHIALMPDWNNFFGYFKFDANGASGNYAGVVTQKLADGSIRVYVDLTTVTTMTGTPSNVVTMLFVRGNWTTANGTISNICINEAAEIAPRGQLLTQTVGNNFVLKNNGVQNSAELTTLSFEYKIVGGERFAVALMPNWSSYFGYFNFNAAASNVYNGVTYEHLEDGYIRVTFDLTKLTLSAGSPSTAISMLYVNPGYCLADVYIDNIQFS